MIYIVAWVPLLPSKLQGPHPKGGTSSRDGRQLGRIRSWGSVWTQVTHAHTDDRCRARRPLSRKLHLLYPTPVILFPSSPGPGSPPHGSLPTSSWKPSLMLSKELTFSPEPNPPWTGHSILADAMLLYPDPLQPPCSSPAPQPGHQWPAWHQREVQRKAALGLLGLALPVARRCLGSLVWSLGTALNY